MNAKIAQLPKPPEWKSRVVTVPGGKTKKPLRLFYRDGLEVFKFLFAHPLAAGHQNFAPTQVAADQEKDIFLFDEPTTGSMMWEVQVRYEDAFA